MKWTEQIERYWQQMLEDPRQLEEHESSNWVLNKKALHESRGSNVVRVTGDGSFYRNTKRSNDETAVEYRLYLTFLIKQGSFFYHEEEERNHQALFYKGKLMEDHLLPTKDENEELPSIKVLEEEEPHADRFAYDRRQAIQYAERWWNSYNPDYETFDVDCTNYVSQCLYAGGAPMRGAPVREKGWWYQDNNWSFSWSVAHSLRWYLSGSNRGLKGKEVESAGDLAPGDIICYDFEGDGNWNHNTIVVAKDNNGMPLVNAHTNNSRHRYWSYEDSAAWTPNCKYKFFRIGE